jgi:DMSO/TMAO reductase YedYZ heme-binding membrane subunit
MATASLPRGAGLLEGRALVAWSALGLAALCAGALGAQGAGEEGVGLVTRATARVACVIFLAAWSASSLRALWPAPATAWLLRNRRYVGLSFATAQLVHLLAIGGLVRLRGDAFEYDPVSLSVGGMAYVFTAALAATSSDRAVAWLGRARWRVLHRVGAHWIFFVFAATLLPKAFASPLHALLAALVAAALAARVAAARRRSARARMR